MAGSRNRLRFDEADSTAPESNESELWFDEPESHRRRTRFRLFVSGGVALLILIFIGFGLYYYRNIYVPAGGSGFFGERVAELDLDGVRERYYIPNEGYSGPLERAIELLRRNQRQQAQRAFEEFVNGDHNDYEKSVALVYLGVMALEVERYAAARHQLLRALRYDNRSAAALVNLAIVERRLGNLRDARDYARQAREVAPNDPRVAILTGNLLADSEDLPGAIHTYREGLTGAPDDPLLSYNLALSLVRNGQNEEAILHFSRVIELAPHSELAVRAHAHLGQLYFAEGRLEMAADQLQKAVQLAPSNPRYQYNLAVVRMRLGDPRRALAHLEKALEAGGGESQVYRSIAEAFVELGQHDKAARALRRAIALNPEDLEAHLALGAIYQNQGDLLRGVEAYQRLLAITSSGEAAREALARLTRLYLELERYNEAIEVAERLVALDPRAARPRLLLGLAYHRSQRPDRAAQVWREALASGSAFSEGNSALPGMERGEEREIRLALASLWREQGAYDLALQQYRLVEARNNEPPVVAEDPELWLEMGRTYLRLQSRNNATTILQRVTQSSQASREMRRDAWRLLAESQAAGDATQLTDARSSIQQAIRLDPADPELRLFYANLLMRSDSLLDREKALETLQALVASDIDSQLGSRSYNLLGVVHYRNGDYSRALRAFDTAVQLDPSNSDAYDNQRSAANAYERSLR